MSKIVTVCLALVLAAFLAQTADFLFCRVSDSGTAKVIERSHSAADCQMRTAPVIKPDGTVSIALVTSSTEETWSVIVAIDGKVVAVPVTAQ